MVQTTHIGIAIILFMVSSPLAAQSVRTDTVALSLAEAVARARRMNPDLRAERAEARAAAQGPLAASRAFLPSLQLDVRGVRTTDPVAVFGTKLRQENFAAADLGLDPLNRPAPYPGYTSSATVTVPVLAPEGLYGYTAARRAAAASAAAARRAAGATEFQVTRAYWDAQLAARRVEALSEALAAARAHVRAAEALNREGLVTGLDARLARVRAAEVETRLVGARAAAANARAGLAAMLALPDSQSLVLTDSLSIDRDPEVAAATGDAPETRADLAALALGVEAASAALRSAWASNLPSLALFGALAYHGRSSPWSNGSGDWTIGIGLTWKPFQALSGVGAVRRARARRDAAEARREAAERQAAVEVANARRMVTAAGERVTVAGAAYDEALAALEQARRRYRTGTSPITELLDVQAAATSAHLSLLSARRDLFVARAALDFAMGAYDR